MSVFRGSMHAGMRYISGRSYLAYAGTVSNTAVAAADTLYLHPWFFARPTPISALGFRVNTAGTASSAKLGAWASDSVGLPTGTPLASNNAGVATTSANTVVSLAATGTLFGVVWFGSVHTGVLPTTFSIAASTCAPAWMIARAALADCYPSTVNFQGLSIAHTYANSITTRDLTGGAFSAVVAAGIPATAFTVA